MTDAIKETDLRRCRKRWAAVLCLWLFCFLFCLLWLANIAMGGLETKPLVNILGCAFSLLFVYLWVGFTSHIRRISLFIHPDGFGYRIGKWPVRLIRWEHLERTSEKYANGVSIELSLKLKQYATLLDRLEGDEIRLWLRDRRLMFWISYLFVFPAKPKDLINLWPEGLSLPRKDPRLRMALRMAWTRSHSGVDLGFSSFLCTREDTTAIEDSYIRFLERQ